MLARIKTLQNPAAELLKVINEKFESLSVGLKEGKDCCLIWLSCFEDFGRSHSLVAWRVENQSSLSGPLN
jgi:hypothetical protein